MSYPELITALNTKLPNSVFRDKTQLLNFLITQIKQRKIDKPLSPDREEILREAGATTELIEVIRQNAIPLPTPKTIQVGVVNSKAINTVRPQYPPAALAAGVAGTVNVQVTIDENGNVISAKAVNGHVFAARSRPKMPLKPQNSAQQF
ncbi:MAG: TonB family protein [Blastocatellia bacterium]|nr:TonB family protein [Blastocatellia bacterium]